MESSPKSDKINYYLESVEEFFRFLSPIEQQNAPGYLYYAGDKTLIQGKRLSIIGSRQASNEGLLLAKEVASYAASQGIIVVSGLAKGIDTAAHRGAIETGGKTIAVLGTPLTKCYPNENLDLQKEIIKNHLCISEFSDKHSVTKGNFVIRNYTMALLSDATLIIEATDNSGTLYQAEETVRLGHPLFIHKHAMKVQAEWQRYFLGKGAKILENNEDLLTI